MLLERTETSKLAYFNDLAQSFLHGHLDVSPPVTGDLTLFQGKWYVPFPPLPTLLLLPWVLFVGLQGTNVALFLVLMGALNVSLACLLLDGLSRRGWSRLDPSSNLWLTALFGVGCVHWYMTTIGTVWFISQVCTLTFLLLAAWLAVVQDGALMPGLALALAMLGRPNVAFMFPLLIGIQLQRRPAAWKETLRWGSLCALPPMIASCLLLDYNLIRFGNPLDFGYLHESVQDSLAPLLQQYGQFNLHYLRRNLQIMFLGLPEWDPGIGKLFPTNNGISLLLTTPALIYLVRPWWKSEKRSWLAAGAWAALILLIIPLVTYYNTGFAQFGYRFSLDFMTPVLVLLALAAEGRVSWKLRFLIAVGILVNAWGTWSFANPRY